MSAHRATARPMRSEPIAPLAASAVFRRLDAKLLDRRERWLTPRRLANLLLLLIEVGAVAAVAIWLASAFRQWQSLLPLQPAPALPLSLAQQADSSPGILPDAHEAPLGGAIPEHLRGIVQPLPALILPTRAPGRPSRMVIAKLGVDAPVVEGDGPEQLKMGIGHRVGTANPGERGNMVVAGHNDVYGELFRDLDRLDAGDEVVVYSGLESFTYVVRQKRIVEPSDLSALQPSPVPILTLVSCYPYLVDTHRIVVVAELAE